jgi:hypothetical protein
VKSKLLVIFLFASAVSVSSEPAVKQFILDKKFFIELHKIHSVLRDTYLESRLNSIVTGKGLITAIDMVQRLNKNYRVVLIDQEAARTNLNISYYIYLADTNTVSILKKNEMFEFTGQLIAYTPLNSKRDSYIFDIILEKGTMLFE